MSDDQAERLLPLVYDELRALAAQYLRAERPSPTLQPTALVHEAYLRLKAGKVIELRSKTHFFALAAVQMRRILVDRARAAATEKCGGGARRMTLSEELSSSGDGTVELLELHEALTRLSRRNERHGQVAEMRLFGGMPINEMASHLGVSTRTVKEDWRVARAWLMNELSPQRPGS